VVFPVAFLTLLPAWAAVAGAPVERPPPVRLTMSAAAERIALPKLHGPVELTVDALFRIIRLRPTKDSPAALASKLAAATGSLCPKVIVRDGAAELLCRNRRVEALLEKKGNLTFLDINEVRGLPWRPGLDHAPSYFFDPWKVGMGPGCPGRSEAAIGECQLKQGHQLDAARAFRNAISTNYRQPATLRLGDLALVTGDPMTAAGWYRRVGGFGVFGRMATQRLCELDGTCLSSTEDVLHVFDTRDLPEPLRAETLMRAARAEAYMGRISSAIHIIGEQVQAKGAASICREDGDLLCRRILLHAMRSAVGPEALQDAGYAAEMAARKEMDIHEALKASDEPYSFESLMQIYFALPGWDRGPLAVELAQAAAAVAQRMGAPGFAGNLLASSAREIPDARLSQHLLMAANAFIKAEDFVRARVVAEYVQTRLGLKGRAGDGWRGVMKTLAARADEDELSSELRAQIEKEVEATLAGLNDAQAAMTKARALISGVKDAQKGKSEGKGEAKGDRTRGGKPDGAHPEDKAEAKADGAKAEAKSEAPRPAPGEPLGKETAAKDRPKATAEGGG
jgi:hypothetical protein